MLSFMVLAIGVLAFTQMVVAQSKTLYFTNPPTKVFTGQPFDLQYTAPNLLSSVNITLLKGNPINLGVVSVLTTTATGGNFYWTPALGLYDGTDYSLYIQQGAESNYIGPFSIGPVSASSSSSSSFPSSSAASSASLTTPASVTSHTSSSPGSASASASSPSTPSTFHTLSVTVTTKQGGANSTVTVTLPCTSSPSSSSSSPIVGLPFLLNGTGYYNYGGPVVNATFVPAPLTAPAPGTGSVAASVSPTLPLSSSFSSSSPSGLPVSTGAAATQLGGLTGKKGKALVASLVGGAVVVVFAFL